ncbi:MAG: hypothetical protein EZS28_047086, partial [Streblomastix strix]
MPLQHFSEREINLLICNYLNQNGGDFHFQHLVIDTRNHADMMTATKYVGIIFEFKIQSHHASNDCSQIYSAIDQIDDRGYCDCYPNLMHYVCVSVIISPREVAVGLTQGQRDYVGVNIERNVLTAVSTHNMDLQ